MSMTVEEALEKHKEDCRRCKDKACERNIQCLQKKDIEIYEEIQQSRAIGTVSEFREAMFFKKYFMELYGEGLEVANWHLNGDLELLDNIIDEAVERGKQEESEEHD